MESRAYYQPWESGEWERLINDRCPPKQGRTCALRPVACILFLIKREGRWRTEEQPVSPLSLLSGPNLELLSFFQGVWRSGWFIIQGVSWLDEYPDLRKGQASSAMESDSHPYSCFSPRSGIWFSTLLPTVFLINSGLVTTASAPSRQTGVGLWRFFFFQYMGKPPPGSIIWLPRRNCPGAVLLQLGARN